MTQPSTSVFPRRNRLEAVGDSHQRPPSVIDQDRFAVPVTGGDDGHLLRPEHDVDMDRGTVDAQGLEPGLPQASNRVG